MSITTKEDFRQRNGLIRLASAKVVKPHHCSPPGTFLRWLLRLFRMPIPVGSVWRCPAFQCGSVYRFHHDNWDAATGNFVWNERWLKETHKVWVEHGGRL